MFAYDFMRHAFEASFLISLMAGLLGWFLLVRQETFVAHALPHIGFAGGAFALCLSVAPMLGVIGGCVVAAIGLAVLKWGGMKSSRVRMENQDQMTGLVLAAGLAAGLGALHWGRQGNAQALNLLFGDLLGQDVSSIEILSVLCVLVLAGLCILGRPLLFASLSHEQAAARGIPVKFVNLSFLCLAGAACGVCSQIAGTLLAFSLLVGPASSSFCLGLSPAKGMIFSCVSALALCWGALTLSWYTDFPPAFWIGLGAGALYIVCFAYKRLIAR